MATVAMSTIGPVVRRASTHLFKRAGWHQFLSILAYKSACAGKRVEAVDPADTTQNCSGCGENGPFGLFVCTHVYTNCGPVLDRDLTAVKSIFWCGQRLRGVPRGH